MHLTQTRTPLKGSRLSDYSPQNESAEDAETVKGTVTRRETLFAPPRRTVVPRPVYRHRLLVALSSRLSARAKTFSVERVQLGLLSIFLFGVLGVFIADIFFCPADTGMKFWDGCMYEVIGFGAGGGLLGLSLFFLLLRRFSPRPTQDS